MFQVEFHLFAIGGRYCTVHQRRGGKKVCLVGFGCGNGVGQFRETCCRLALKRGIAATRCRFVHVGGVCKETDFVRRVARPVFHRGVCPAAVTRLSFHLLVIHEVGGGTAFAECTVGKVSEHAYVRKVGCRFIFFRCPRPGHIARKAYRNISLRRMRCVILRLATGECRQQAEYHGCQVVCFHHP